jgi:hypothetical protein
MKVRISFKPKDPAQQYGGNGKPNEMVLVETALIPDGFKLDVEVSE